MPIQYVGGVSGQRAGSTSTTTQSLNGTLVGGVDTSPKPHDFVVVTCVVASQARNPAQAITTPAGFTAIGQLNPNATTYDTSLNVSYKRMANPADTSITIPATGNTADGQAWMVQVFRGVDFDNPLDVAAVAASATGTQQANPGAITPVTAGAWVLACAGGAGSTAAAFTFAGMSNANGSANTTGTNRAVVTCATTTWTSGAYDPPQSTTGGTTSTFSWAAYTIALRPQMAMGAHTDNFDDNALDTGKWATEVPAGTSITESGGVINIDVPDSSFANLWTNGYRCLTGSEAVAKLTPPAGVSGAASGWEVGFLFTNDYGGTIDVSWISDGTSTGAVRSRYSGTPFGTSVAYSAGTHAWLRVRESAGTVYVDFAPASAANPPASGDWVNYSSVTTATIGFHVSAMACAMRSVRGAGLANPSAPAKFDGFNAAANATVTNTTSVADPATYSLSGVAATSLALRVSQGTPAAYSLTAATATSGRSVQSSADPTTYAHTATAATAYRALLSQATAASYSVAGAAGADLRALLSSGNPATYSYVPQAATSGRATMTSANPATYSLTATPATALKQPGGVALPATYSMAGAAATSRVVRLSVATPAAFLMEPATTTVTGTFSQTSTTPVEPPYIPPVVSDVQFLAWLQDPTAIRVVLLETQCIDEIGNTRKVYLASRGYVSTPRDNVANQHYLPLMRGGLDFKQTLGLDTNSEQSYGDIELDNSEGDLDDLFGMMWQYQPARAFVGDARWPRNDFRQIFDGSVEDIDSSQRDTLNIRLRDKLHRLEMPLTDQKIGGAGTDADQLLPLAFGECHNVTPVLLDSHALKYVFHVGTAESVFEVRDNGVPIQRLPGVGAPATFILPKQPFGRITASIQGDSQNGYANDVASIVKKLVKEWGTESDKRLTDSDIDQTNFDLFKLNNPQPVGLWVTDRMTVREASQQVAAAVGARVFMPSDGKLRLVKIEVPPLGTPIDVTESDMEHGSLRIVNRLPLAASVRLGYCRNWTVQPDTASGLPEEHKAMYAREWFSTTVVDNGTRLKYNLWAEPPQENTLLLRQDDAGYEAARRLWLRMTQRHVYEFVGYADLILTPVGAPMRLTHRRFGLADGKVGQVVAVSVNWINAKVTIQVVI